MCIYIHGSQYEGPRCRRRRRSRSSSRTSYHPQCCCCMLNSVLTHRSELIMDEPAASNLPTYASCWHHLISCNENVIRMESLDACCIMEWHSMISSLKSTHLLHVLSWFCVRPGRQTRSCSPIQEDDWLTTPIFYSILFYFWNRSTL